MVQEGTAELNKVSPKVSDNSIPKTELGGISPTPPANPQAIRREEAFEVTPSPRCHTMEGRGMAPEETGWSRHR